MKTLIISLGVACAFALAAHAQDVTKATCKLDSKSGSKVVGMITFTKAGDDVQVVGDITGLTAGKHGFHIHEKGDCSAPDAASAGAHFNPTNQHHGGTTTPPERHTGDLGNIEANAEGVATLDWTDSQLGFDGHHGIVGRAVIVHAKADDLKTQPTGDAGGRLACGVIGIAK